MSVRAWRRGRHGVAWAVARGARGAGQLKVKAKRKRELKKR